MPKKRLEAPITGTEKELFDALERLKNGTPTNPELLKKTKLKKLRISETSVAKEAGRSRTLIAHDKCSYPRVRAAILALKNPETPLLTFEEINRNLRKDNAELKDAAKTAMDRVAALVRRLDAVETEAKRRIKEVERKYGQQAGENSSNHIAGAGMMPQPGKVIRLQPPRDEE